MRFLEDECSLATSHKAIHDHITTLMNLSRRRGDQLFSNASIETDKRMCLIPGSMLDYTVRESAVLRQWSSQRNAQKAVNVKKEVEKVARSGNIPPHELATCMDMLGTMEQRALDDVQEWTRIVHDQRVDGATEKQ
ncbi:hypothetical protein E1B28_009361 [Marasmius oreades]|uniref:Uncharacterized protein n=1 Tax=Marasmius oreades TaxID=181124 RepID=A0A9P7S0B3_9AGAR|nr:uncharacterized protein E1B28_009361 [Marasmius oreades]KAG7093071.1 hypothetical protein E1B28_009361 [Marasmius oreades]